MPDIIGTISNAIAIAARLTTISRHVREAEFQKLLPDLQIDLSEANAQIAALLDENTGLKRRVRELEGVDADPCPRCRKRTWRLQSSERHPTFGNLGGNNRTYTCSACGFTETRLEKTSRN